MSATAIGKIISKGLQDVLTVKLNAGCTAYETDVAKWTGETALVFTPSRQATELASGNDPAWWVKEGLCVGDVELTLYDIGIADMERLFGVKYTATDGLVVGDFDDGVVFVGLSCDRLVETPSASSRNKIILYKVRFELPAIDAKTISKDDSAIGELKLKGYAYPVFFTKTNGDTGARTYCIVNSSLNATKYAANASTIVFPTEITPAPSGNL